MNLKAIPSDAPKISIVVPVRNMARTIGRTLQSILDQRGVDPEIIVVDGASTDTTLQAIKPYECPLAHLISEEDSGYYEAVNKGIALATGEVIGILNGDDYYKHDGVLALYAERFRQGDIDLAFSDLEFFSAENPKKTVRFYSSRRFSPTRLRFGWMPPHPTIFVRREIYELVGNYRTDYRISADFEFLVRALLKHKLNWARIDTVAVRMQYGGLSTSGIRASFRLNQEILRACRANGLRSGWLLILLKVPAKLLEFGPPRR